MQWDYLIILMISLALGSFYNTCIYRIPVGLSLLGNRSICPSCESRLSFWELIPIVSFLSLGRRCRHCKRNIPWQYPVVEAITAVSLFIFYSAFGVSISFLQAVIFLGVLLPVIIIDWKHFLIPNGLLLTGGVSWFFVEVVGGRGNILDGIFAGGINIGVMILIVTVGHKISGRTVLGIGDVKLAGMLGLFLGWENSLLNLWFAAVLAVAYGCSNAILLKRRFYGMRLPFGSFLGGSAIIVLLLRDEIDLIIRQWLTTLL
jgi:leader peptidase (prepilin peptidase)/N-methyltransferase